MSDAEATLERFKALFNQLDSKNQEGLAEVYAPDIRFRDPLTEVVGLEALKHYFAGAYENVLSCHFEYGLAMGGGNDIALPWVMHLRHRKLSSGNEVLVEGISHIQVRDDRVIYHRDYFDAGQMLYENVPVLGPAVRWLRRYAA